MNVLRAHIVRPRVGAWHAEIVVDADTADAFAGAISIVLAGQMTFQGFARRVGAHHNTVFVRAVGGAGGLGKTVPPRSWQNVPLRIPLTDALAAVGETLSSISDPSTLGSLLPKWSRPQRGAGLEVAALAAAVPGAVWRVLPDGTIWVGPETWPAVSIDFQEVEYEPSVGRLEFGSDLPAVAPGQVFVPDCGEPYASRKVSSVEHVADAKQLRNFVTFEDPTIGGDDRLTRGLASFVRSVVGAQLDFLALYPAKVIAQNADGTLELRPDDARLSDYSGVPIRLGLPGASVKVSAGRVLLGFAGGDPRKPIAELWEGGATVTEIDLAGATIKLGVGATDALVKGTTYRSAEDTLLTAIGAYATAIKPVADPSNVGTTTLLTAISTFQAAATTYLSTIGKTA